VKLPGFPMELWNKDLLKYLGDGIGITLEPNFQTTVNGKVIKIILVEIDGREGSWEEIGILWGNWKFIQIMDYLKFPFRCSNCHSMKHVWKEFVSSRRKWILKEKAISLHGIGSH